MKPTPEQIAAWRSNAVKPYAVIDDLHVEKFAELAFAAGAAAHTAALLEGVEMPEAHQLFTERCGHFVVTADQLRSTVAAAVLRKDADIVRITEERESWRRVCETITIERDALTNAIGAKQLADFVAKHAAPQSAAEPVRVYLVATGEVHEGQETYTRHDVLPPLCDAETLYIVPPTSRKQHQVFFDGGWHDRTEEEMPVYKDGTWTERVVYLGAAPQSEPSTSTAMTDAQAMDLLPTNTSMSRTDALLWVLRATERHHKIGAKP